MTEEQIHMTDIGTDLAGRLYEHEAGVADLIAAYEIAEPAYFAAVNATAQYIYQPTSSDSAAWVPDADLG